MRTGTLLPRVLMYHSITRPRNENDALCTSPERFEAQMLYLKRHNLQGVSMRELYQATTAGNVRGLVGLTFDDGYEDFLSTALPTLETLGFSATLFVVAGMLGGENIWEPRDGSVPRLRLLGEDGVREVSERGMEVGSHSVTHPRLSTLNPEAQAREAEDSRQILDRVLNESVEGFCYPYGDLNVTAVRAAREAGYAYAVATKKQVEWNLHDWPRTYVGDRDSPFRFGVKLRTSQLLFRLRRRYAD